LWIASPKREREREREREKITTTAATISTSNIMRERMINEVHYKGLMVLDDIHMDEEMERWWKELQDNANEWG
jgi:hypothetical protein